TAGRCAISATAASSFRPGRSIASRRSTPCSFTCSGIRSTSRWGRTMSSDVFGVCPAPIHDTDAVLLGHGTGGRLSAELIEKLILPAFRNPALEALDDSAVLALGAARIAFTTDSYVVSPIFFPGGDIGELAVNGTINDLAMGGARPVALSLSLILEEGLP